MAIVEDITPKVTSKASLKRSIDYILQTTKTNDNLIGSNNCDKYNPYKDFIFNKKLWNKEDGRYFKHFTQAFHPDEKKDLNLFKKLADEMVLNDKWKDYQIIYAIHTDNKHIHIHYIINTVNVMNGKKYQQSEVDLNELKDYSDRLCKKYGLSVIDKEEAMKKREERNKLAEDKAIKNGVSWKEEMLNNLRIIKDRAVSKKHFIYLLKTELNYSIKWIDTRKHITYIDDKNHKCRCKKLADGEEFSKEVLENKFNENLMKWKEEIASKYDKYLQKESINNNINTLSFTSFLKNLTYKNNISDDNKYILSNELSSSDLKDLIENQKKNKGFNYEK